MIDGTPEVKRLSIDTDENLIQVPAPPRIASMLDTPLPDFGGEHRSEPIPSQTHCLVADVDAPFEENVFDLPQR